MQNLSDYLKKFSKILFDKTGKARVVQKAIEEVAFIKLGESQIRVVGGVVFIQASSIQKNSIYLLKQKILEVIKGYGLTSITEIR